MRRTLRITAACAVLGLAISCGSSGGGGDTAAFQAALQGTWAGCVQGTNSLSLTFTITGLSYTVVTASPCNGTGSQQSGTLTIGSPETVQLNGQSVTAYQVNETTTNPNGTLYTLAYVDTTASPNNLYIGDIFSDPNHDGSSADKRPTALLPLPFPKQPQ